MRRDIDCTDLLFAVFIARGLAVIRVRFCFGLVEEAELGIVASLAARAEALTLEQPDILAQLRDLLAVLGDGLLMLGLELSLFFLMLLGLQKHQRPQFLDGVGKICGRHHVPQASTCILNYKTVS